MTTQTCSLECASGPIWFPKWNGEPRVIATVAALAAAVWIPLAIAVLLAGPTRFGSGEPRHGIRTCAWIGGWLAGVALMVLTYVAASDWIYRNGPVDPTQPSSAWPTPGSAVGWGELPICAAWLAVGAVMTWTLAASHSRDGGRRPPSDRGTAKL